MDNIVTEVDRAFSGPIYRFVWKKNSFVKGPKMPFPKKTKIFGLAIGDVRKSGGLDLVKMEDTGRLTMTAFDGDKKNKKSWSSSEAYGGTIVFYDDEAKRKLWVAGNLPAATNWRVYIPGRILIKDLDGDGFNEVVVNKNMSSTTDWVDKIRRFEKGEIYNLVWDGAFTTNWKSKEIGGCITDFQIKDIDNDGEEELVVAAVDIGAITDRKGTSNILFFKLF
jgi:hypothetical protein